MTRIAVIDFETASHQSHSACQLGLVIVESWQVVHEQEWLIRPPRLYFSPRCIAVHGIRPQDVLNSPTWDAVWTELQPLIDGCVVIAHNVGFDAGVLAGTCGAYDIAISNIDLQCTRLIAKRAWPGMTSYSLANLAEFLGIQFKHHNALEDARACSQILRGAASKTQTNTFEELEDRLGLLRGKLWTDRVRQPRTIRRSRIEMVAESQPRFEPKTFRQDGVPLSATTEHRLARIRADQILAACGTERPFDGKHVVLVNSLLGLDRDDAIGFLQQLGAIVQSQINLQTHYLILGTPSRKEDESAASHPSMSEAQESHRLDEVNQRQKEGQPIRILSQRQLLACIPSGLAIARGDL